MKMVDRMDKVYLGEMNLSDVREFFKKGDTIFVPIGTTEQHGPHSPYATDMLIPFEVTKRAARKMGALVAPPLAYGLSQSHKGFPAIIWLSGKTLTAVIGDVAMSLAIGGFKRIVFVNGHYCNDQPLFVAITDTTNDPNLPRGTKIYGITYWNVMSPKVGAKYLSWRAGWHANIGETSAILAIDEKFVDMSKAPVEWPAVEEDISLLNISAAQTGGFYAATKSGIWGDARKSTKRLGEEFLEDIANGLVRTLARYEKNYGSGPAKRG